jgi:hypothetical protein
MKREPESDFVYNIIPIVKDLIRQSRNRFGVHIAKQRTLEEKD